MPGQEPLGPVNIGPREIYDAVQQLRADVQRLSDRRDVDADQLNDHEKRLRSMERTRWPLPHLAILLSAAATAVALFVR